MNQINLKILKQHQNQNDFQLINLFILLNNPIYNNLNTI